MTKKSERVAVFHPEFRQDLRYWVETNRRVAFRVLDLVEAVMRDPFQGIGKPEPLKYVLAGAWSRRITEEHRLVYAVTAEGGFFMNLDYLRPSSPMLRPLWRWSATDTAPEFAVRYHSRGAGGGNNPGTIEEQLVWLREAGFGPVDCFWKEFQAALFGGFKGAVRIPEPPV